MPLYLQKLFRQVPRNPALAASFHDLGHLTALTPRARTPFRPADRFFPDRLLWYKP
jgi:hypothetical protein